MPDPVVTKYETLIDEMIHQLEREEDGEDAIILKKDKHYERGCRII